MKLRDGLDHMDGNELLWLDCFAVQDILCCHVNFSIATLIYLTRERDSLANYSDYSWFVMSEFPECTRTTLYDANDAD